MANTPKGRFVPLPVDHPCVGMICTICGLPLLSGDAPTVDEGPDVYFDSDRASCGLSFRNSPSTVMHEKCVYPAEPKSTIRKFVR